MSSIVNINDRNQAPPSHTEGEALTPAEAQARTAALLGELSVSRLSDVFKDEQATDIDILNAIACKMAESIDELDDATINESESYMVTDTRAKIVSRKVTALKALTELVEHRKKLEAKNGLTTEEIADHTLRFFLGHLKATMVESCIDIPTQQVILNTLRGKVNAIDDLKKTLTTARVTHVA